PLNQVFFALAALLGGKSILGSVIWLRIFIIAADIGILYFGRKLLKQLNLPESNIFLYLLNPLIIIELTGNLHFEGVMLFFMVAGLYLLQRQKWLFSALLFSCSIAVKL
ncbi:mannosyltransferase, partial [Salinimicrobium sp. CDJ15-91]|nr:mannosyltransferase [Salinimicrobium oceani]